MVNNIFKPLKVKMIGRGGVNRTNHLLSAIIENAQLHLRPNLPRISNLEKDVFKELGLDWDYPYYDKDWSIKPSRISDLYYLFYARDGLISDFPVRSGCDFLLSYFRTVSMGKSLKLCRKLDPLPIFRLDV